VHPDSKNTKGTLANFLALHFPEIRTVGESWFRPGIVHRLDKDTTGLMLIPTNQKSFLYYKDQFGKRQMKKSYWALCYGKIKEKEGIMDWSIGRSPKDTTLRSTAPYAKNRKEALTNFKVSEIYRYSKSQNQVFYYTAVNVFPHTGRTHQIRVHLKSLGFPIVGDPLYRFKRSFFPVKENHRLFLMAQGLSFKDQSGQDFSFKLDLDRELKASLTKLELCE
jgi:23S rRNA pseudouridine1911/1915/1917 synthase